MCEICGGSGWKRVERDGVEEVTRCDCWQARLVEHQLTAARIPRRYRHCELGNFEQHYDSLREAHRKARAFIDAFPVVDRGLLFFGRSGVGKTHLAAGVLKEVIREKGARGYFYETDELLKLIRNTYNRGHDETEMEVLTPVLTADLLVLDDLNVEKSSEWVQETLGLVVNTRYSQNRATIITTNLIDTANDAEPNSFIFRLGFRVRSRLKEMCDWIEMDGVDVRELSGPDATPEEIERWNRESPAAPGNRGRGRLPDRSRGMARAQLRDRGTADLKWSGGKAGR